MRRANSVLTFQVVAVAEARTADRAAPRTVAVREALRTVAVQEEEEAMGVEAREAHTVCVRRQTLR